MENYKNSENEMEKLLNDFLNQMEVNKKAEEAVSYPMKIDDNKLPLVEEYPEVENTPELVKKIDRLNKIAARIDEKPTLKIDESTLKHKYKIEYKNNLNLQQLAATVITKGPMLVIAGAGSGKTRVIIHRLAFLIENGTDASEILLLTFTRKAAKEMITRAEELLNMNVASQLKGGTFHAFANYALRKYSNLVGLSPNFTIIDASDAEDTVDLIKTELQLGKSGKAFPKKERIYELISSARNRNKTLTEVIETEFTGLTEYIKDIELIARGYTRYKEICRILDYDDLMEILRDKLRDNLIFRNYLQLEFSYIMVDEFQDTNLLQKEIVDFLAERHKNIMVVGDDSQSIYSFRGANYENILLFPETYPDCNIVKLEQNYRSNQTLLDFTNQIINNARIGYRKKLYSDNRNYFKPIVKKFYNEIEEAEFIVNHILELREKGIELKNIAVLNRAAWHWRHVEIELIKKGIPYVTVGGLAFHERKHIKDFISFLRIILNPFDAVAWHRILKLIPGVGKVSANQMIADIRQNHGKLNIEIYRKRKNAAEIAELSKMLVHAESETLSMAGKLETVCQYYLPILKSTETDFNIRVLDIQVFIEMASKYENLTKLLSEFTLEPPTTWFANKSRPLIDESEEKPLTLSTVHSAKGLEWYCVFIPHALDGLFPSVRAIKNLEEIEEERRLFYVASSRAKEELFITMPSFVQTYNAFLSYPSRFIVEIEKTKYDYLQ